MIGVKGAGDATDMPAGIGFAPDGLVEGQRGL